MAQLDNRLVAGSFREPAAAGTRQLARTPYLAGDSFTAADISVTYALQLAQRTGCSTLGEVVRAYVARTSGREAYQRAMDSCQATKAWVATLAG